MERKRKTLADFPFFTVASMRKQPPDVKGHTDFEIEGAFDRIIKRSEITWFWLLSKEGDSFCVQWKSEDDKTLAAVLTGCQANVPDLAGATLYYLSPCWQAFHVGMVLAPQWGWQRVRFEAIDAQAQNYESQEVSIVNGREVKTWTKLERADKKGHASRHYPASDEASVSESAAIIVPGGWDHEHCELCRTHINPGYFGYRDLDDRWMCEACYKKYVEPRDLSFVDEL